tara:strand:+ start:2365 stop:2562 length:198 start_codon:yes stop_codon:yes gene_type:complete
MAEVRYTALVKLLIPNPKGSPGAIRVSPGEDFYLDGSEGIRVDLLLRQRAIKRYRKPREKGAADG